MSFNSTEVNLYGHQSPIDCYILNMIAIYCIVLLMLSLFFNIALLVIFAKHKKLRSPLNVFIISITVLNLIGSISELSFVIPTNIKCRWLTGKIGCKISGFIMYLVGCSSIFIMTAICVQRFLIIYKPFTIKKITYANSFAVLCFCLVFGLFWAVMPLNGWSYYSLEAGLTSCSVEWADRSWNVLSYNVSIFIWVFGIPVFLMVFCNVGMIVIIKRMSVIQDKKSKARLQKERQLTFTLIIYVFAFIISWSPYAFVAMYSAFIDSKDITPLGATLPAMFAKSSMVWSTILFIYSNRSIKSKFNYIEVSKSSIELNSTTNKERSALRESFKKKSCSKNAEDCM